MNVYILWASTPSYNSGDFILDIYSSYTAAHEEKRRLERRLDAYDITRFRYSIEEREVIGE